MEIFNNFLVQLGAIGIMIVGLIWFSKRMINHVMQELRSETERNKQLEQEFRDYLKEETKEHHELIKKNTEAFQRFISLMEGGFMEYLKDTQNGLTYQLKSLVDELNKRNKST